MMPSTRRSSNDCTTRTSRSGSALRVGQEDRVIRARLAGSSMPLTTPATNGSAILVTTTPMVSVRRVTRLRAAALGT